MEPTDIELMLRVKADDMAAFRTLVFRYRDPLRRFFVSLLADPAQADDGVQETFLRVWTLRAQYQPTGKFSTYLFQIAKHYGWNQRKKFRLPVVEIADAEIEIVSGPRESEPETALLAQDRREAVQRAIAALPEPYRAVFTLSHVEGLKYAEIACRLEIPVGTVKSRMAEAVRRLRQRLTEEEQGDG